MTASPNKPVHHSVARYERVFGKPEIKVQGPRMHLVRQDQLLKGGLLSRILVDHVELYADGTSAVIKTDREGYILEPESAARIIEFLNDTYKLGYVQAAERMENRPDEIQSEGLTIEVDKNSA